MKILYFFLCLIFAITISGCDKKEENPVNQSDDGFMEGPVTTTLGATIIVQDINNNNPIANAIVEWQKSDATGTTSAITDANGALDAYLTFDGDLSSRTGKVVRVYASRYKGRVPNYSITMKRYLPFNQYHFFLSPL